MRDKPIGYLFDLGIMGWTYKVYYFFGVYFIQQRYKVRDWHKNTPIEVAPNSRVWHDIQFRLSVEVGA